jgi:streptogramin lyase
MDKTGNLYVTDDGNNNIRKITPAGIVSTLAGGNGFGYLNGTGKAALFNNPYCMVTDPQGNVYVTDWANNVIRKITPAGVATTFAGSTQGYQDGPLASAKFNEPSGIAIDTAGNMYVSEEVNQTIRKIDVNGMVTTVAGYPNNSGYVDGAGPAARFFNPLGIALDAQNNIYVADHNNHIIRKITPGGLVTTLAGTGALGFKDGLAPVAQFKYPQDVTIGADGNIYVADSGNHCIRLLQ